MFSLSSRVTAGRASLRAFSTTRARNADLAKLILIGRLGKDPEVRTTRSDKEYVSYTVGTNNYPPPPPNADGSWPKTKTTWHTVLSFNPSANNYLRNLQKGSHVYVEANFEIREPEPDADPDSTRGQRQILLRHEHIRVLKTAKRDSEEGHEE
ncbi:nucleic acid-binding protein [Panus rudis PR-1116 ss-1]|nr:nucleic acid-binding protein [Panus rudis PR-1116 ss-1]